ncbi:MAG: hypothetical protein MJE63_02800 [Proteobacteria bacterium]|nr:hypothetical protein [Pseudomonadota bacterium]
MNLIFKKKNQQSSRSGLLNFQQNLRKRVDGLPTIDGEKKAQHIKNQMQELLKMFPGSPEFLGKAEYVVKKRKKLRFFKRKYPDITELRDTVNRFAAQKRLADPRSQIKRLLKKYPAYPDLRALNAIQIYNDASQSGLDTRKTKVVQGSLREITRAMYNDGMSLFNINWFIKIYVRYLDALRDKFQHEYNSTRNHYLSDIRMLSDQLRRKQIQLTVMSSVRTKLSGLSMLNAKLKGSIYTISDISKEEVKKASLAIKTGDGSKKIGDSGKTANNIIYIIMTLNLMFARIPILNNLVNAYLKATVDANRDIVLQKIMVGNMRRVTEFQLQMASGNRNKTQEVASKLYENCLEAIKQYLDHGVLTKQFEIDPFIRAAWVVKESKGLFKDSDYRAMLENAIRLIEIIYSKRVQVKGAFELARNLQDDIHFIMIEAGWMK